MKSYKVVNRFRFVCFLTVLVLAFSFVSIGILNLVSAKEAKETKCIEVQVVSGDTIWKLAKTYGDADKDVREMVYDICQLNNIKAEDLKAGQTLLIPVK